MSPEPRFRRVVLKLSGEMLAGGSGFGIHPSAMNDFVRDIAEVQRLGVQVGVVIGGGNIVRGATISHEGLERVTGEYMGMLATAINALALQDCLEREGIHTRVMGAIEMKAVCEPYIRRRAIRHLEKGRVVIFACGTGNPFFTTDTAAALRCKEIHGEVLLKGTKVDGIYDKDPAKHPDAVAIKKITFHQALSQRLAVMDGAALSLCMEHHVPLIVFSMGHGNFARIVRGEDLGTSVTVD